MVEFVPGAELNAEFYREIVAGIASPWRHQAALLGWGSDVLGYDTERSTDHGWGPRLLLFVEPADVAPLRAAVDAQLPGTFAGWPVRYGWDEIAPRHWVTVSTLGDWLDEHLGFDPRDGMAAADWLATPQQRLLGVVRGAIYRDEASELAALREQLRWYPHELWVWLVGCQWGRIAREEAFVGRAAEVGDNDGSRLVAARLVREVMRLAFLLAREYWPYSKWFGTAFARLDDPDGLGEALGAVLAADSHPDREAALVAAYEIVARRHNAAAITEAVDATGRPYLSRPYRVILAARFVEACHGAVTDTGLAGLPPVGSIDQFVDSTDVLRDPPTARRLRSFYEQRGDR